MRNALFCFAIGLAFLDAQLQSSDTTLAPSKILALRLLAAALVFSGWAAPLTIPGGCIMAFAQPEAK